MAEPAIRVSVDGQALRLPAGTVAAAAIARADGVGRSRRSVGGEPRGALCGMGICFECRATVDGRRHVRTCMIRCRDGMEIRTDG